MRIVLFVLLLASNDLTAQKEWIGCDTDEMNYIFTFRADSIILNRGGFLKDKIIYESDSLIFIEYSLPQINSNRTPKVLHSLLINSQTMRLEHRKFSNVLISDSLISVESIYLEFNLDECFFVDGSGGKVIEKHPINSWLYDEIMNYYREIEP